MTGADLQWSEYEIPIGALDEGTDRRLLPPGQFASVVNCEFTSKDGSFRKRPGCILVSDPLSASVGFQRLIPHKQREQLLAADLKGSSTVSPGLYTLLDSPIDGDQLQAPRRVGPSPNCLISKTPIQADYVSNVIADAAFVETAGTFGFMVYGIVHPRDGAAFVRVVQVVKSGDVWNLGHVVLEKRIYYSIAGADVFSWVRAAASNDTKVLITFQARLGAIHGVLVDCTASPTPTVSALTSLAITNDVTAAGDTFHDLAGSTSDEAWYVAYTSSDDVRLARYDAAITSDWDVIVEAGSAVSVPRGLSVLEHSGTVWTNYYLRAVETPANSTWRYAANTAVAGAVTTAPTTWCASADIGAGPIAGVSPQSSISATESTTAVLLFHSQAYDSGAAATTLAEIPITIKTVRLTRWRRGRTNASMDGLRQKRNCSLASKVWRDRVAGWYFAWCATKTVERWYWRGQAPGSDIDPFPTFSDTGCLVRFAEAAGAEAGQQSGQLWATYAGNAFGYPDRSSEDFAVLYGGSYPPPRSVTHPTTVASLSNAAEKLGRHVALNERYIPTEMHSTPWDVVVHDVENEDLTRGYGRMQAVDYGGSTYMTGGLLTQWSGDRMQETGIVTAPIIVANNTDTGAEWGAAFAPWADKHIYLQAVYETVYANGERVRSATSAVCDILLNSDGASGRPNNDILVYLEPLTLTAREYDVSSSSGSAGLFPQVLVTVYGSSEPDGQVLHRLFEIAAPDPTGIPYTTPWTPFISNFDATAPITFVIDGTVMPYKGDEPITASGTILSMDPLEVIYNDSGELDNDLPSGGCTCIEVHKERIWIGGTDNPEVVWYSKERVEGRPAEFAFGQQVKLPGHRVVGLKSLDDALYVFCERGIFAIYGEGPNATGDPGSGFFTVVPVSTTVGCTSASSLAAVPAGILFTSEAGECLLNRGRAIEFIKAVGDSSSVSRAPLCATVFPTLQQARIVLQPDGDNLDVLVYDWDANKWATWRYAFPDTSVSSIAEVRQQLYILTADGNVYREDADHFADGTVAYRQDAQLGWLSFGRFQGYKRARRFSALFEPNPWEDLTDDPTTFPFGLKFTFDFNYAEEGFSSEHFFHAYELGQTEPTDGVSWVRIHMPYQKQPSVRVRLTERPPMLRITSPNVDATIDTSVNNILKIRIAPAPAVFSTFTVTSSAALTKAALLTSIQANIASAGMTDFLRARLSGNQLILETIAEDSQGRGSTLEIDSVANGSTLSTPLGLNAAGEVGTPAVAANRQSGFILQSIAFQVGQAPGLRRLPALQSK